MAGLPGSGACKTGFPGAAQERIAPALKNRPSAHAAGNGCSAKGLRPSCAPQWNLDNVKSPRTSDARGFQLVKKVFLPSWWTGEQAPPPLPPPLQFPLKSYGFPGAGMCIFSNPLCRNGFEV